MNGSRSRDQAAQHLFVPTSIHSQVVNWAHTAKLICHPGVHHTKTFLQHFFWWPPLPKDIGEYVTTCSTCTKNKLVNKSPSGLLQHLSIPGALDFITGLPPSAGNTVIPTIIDCFSKAAHFLALSKLLTDLEMAQPLTTCSFHP